ncbi:hypothetical protein ABPG77_006768 [Micractinium sp. CCAP 211/92]
MAAAAAAAQGSPPGVTGEEPATEAPGPLVWPGLYNDCLGSDEDSRGSVMQAAGVAHGQEGVCHRQLAEAQGQSEDEEAPRREQPAAAAAEPARAQAGPSDAAKAVTASQPVGLAEEEPATGQPKGQARKSKSSPYNRLRRFATLCGGVFERAGLRLEGTGNPSAASLIDQLTIQLGAAALSDFQASAHEDRDEYERFADLLNACAGTKLGGRQAVEFFDIGSYGWRSKPDFKALHAAGLYPAAWQLPLVPAAVQEVQSFQAAARWAQGSSSRAALVGQRVAVCYPDGNWYDGTVVDINRAGSRIRIEFDDGDEDLVGLEGTMLFLGERAEVPAGGAGRRKQSRVKQRNLQEAMAAIHRVYAGHLQAQDRLLALHCLELAGIGGEALRSVVDGWEGYTGTQQQVLVDVVALTAEGSDWPLLEGRLQRALQLHCPQQPAPQPGQ